MMGYLDDEEANRRLWDGDFFHTGDLATRDEDGFLFYRGRFDGIIKTKGYRVSPVEIEDVLSLHPAVYECLAVGEPDPDLGQRVKVYVMLAPGYAPSQALEDELMAFHNNACAGFKKIRALEFVDALAHNANGKLIRGSSAPKTDHPIPKRGDEPSSSRFSLPVSGGAPPARKRLTDFCPPFIIRKEKNPCITTVGGGALCRCWN
mgnify:FL=1